MIGMMNGSRRLWASWISLIPSTAESTEIAGVITPSPYNSAAPKSPRAINAILRNPTGGAGATVPRGDGGIGNEVFGGTLSASSARIPPSPWLSARMMNVRYLMEIASVRAQKKSDTIPRTLSGVARIGWCSTPCSSGCAAKHSSRA